MVTDLPTTTFSGVNVMAVKVGFTVKKQNLKSENRHATSVRPKYYIYNIQIVSGID
jgi:hypothetical protein